MTISQALKTQSSLFLRRVIQIDAGLFTLVGLLLILDAGPIAAFLEVSNISIIMTAGVLALLYDGGRFLWATWSEPLDQRLVYISLYANAVWFVGSVILLVTNLIVFSDPFWWVIVILTDLAGLFALLQWVGIRKERSTQESIR